MIKAYLDTCIVSGLAKEDLPSAEQMALLIILRFHKSGDVQLVTSILVKEEIDKIPEEHRMRHEIVYNLLANIPVSQVSWTDSGLTLMGVGGGKKVDSLYLELKALLPDELDAQHIFQAVKSGAKYFVTTDNHTILKYREALITKYNLSVIAPSELEKTLNLHLDDSLSL